MPRPDSVPWKKNVTKAADDCLNWGMSVLQRAVIPSYAYTQCEQIKSLFAQALRAANRGSFWWEILPFSSIARAAAAGNQWPCS